MDEVEEITSRVRVLDIVENPPTLVMAEETHPPRGGRRTFTQSVPVADPGLFARLRAAVSRGDSIDVTVATSWGERDYSTVLVGFAVPQAAEAKIAAQVA